MGTIDTLAHRFLTRLSQVGERILMGFSRAPIMVELRLLGPIQLTAPGGGDVETLVRRSKRAALLAYLAAAVPRGFHRRDKLVALFWPELDDQHARAALSQALYVLRNALGDGAIVTQGDEEVGLGDDAIWCDAAAFEAALDAGRSAEALALYRGELLDGFFIPNAPGFERWLDVERARLRQRAAEGAWALAEAKAAGGDAIEAARWGRRAGELLPGDEAVARRLMAFLHRLGDRPAAIRAYEAFAWELAKEYELEPSAETQALAATIRTEPPHSVQVRSKDSAPVPPREPPANHHVADRRPVRSRRVIVTVGAAVLVIAALGLWLPDSPPDAGARDEPPRLVVLPFQNLGSPDDEYFADGITDEITGRLASISRLRVISRTSAVQYKSQRKTLPEIGEELRVDYVLEGTFRTDRSSATSGEVRVTPRLVRVADDAQVWTDRYSARLVPGEVFRVQAEIAERVAKALDVNLLEPELGLLRDRATDDFAAYDSYLRGSAHFRRSFNEEDTRAAVQMYEQAVALDSAFALAYARLGLAHARLYFFFYDRSERRLAESKTAVDRALALDPDLPEAHIALGYYHYWGHLAYQPALAAFRTAQRLRPNNAELLEGVANVRRRQGAFDEAIASFSQGFELDPRSGIFAFNLAQTLALGDRPAEAEHYFKRTMSLTPDFAAAYWNSARLHLNSEGNVLKAREALHSPTAPDGDAFMLYHAALIDIFDRQYDDALRRVASHSADAFDNQWRFVPKAQLRAQIHALMGRPDLARADYNAARVVAERRVRERPTEANFHSALGIAYAGLGRRTEAVSEATRAVELLPVTKEAWRGLYRLEDLARVLVMIGDYDAALEQLEALVSLPGGRSIPFLGPDPVWDPLRDRPRFQRLVARSTAARK